MVTAAEKAALPVPDSLEKQPRVTPIPHHGPKGPGPHAPEIEGLAQQGPEGRRGLARVGQQHRPAPQHIEPQHHRYQAGGKTGDGGDAPRENDQGESPTRAPVRGAGTPARWVRAAEMALLWTRLPAVRVEHTSSRA